MDNAFHTPELPSLPYDIGHDMGAGNDVGSLQVASPESCSMACQEDPACIAWTMRVDLGPTCYKKSTSANRVAIADLRSVSGTRMYRSCVTLALC
jgi:hypothetical protein